MNIKSKAKYLLASMVVAVLGVTAVVAPDKVSAYAYCPDGSVVDGDLGDCEGADTGPARNTDLMGTFNTIINVALGIIGFLAVVMIIVGGVMYTTSAGDAGKVTKAKNTIMYGVIGLVIALLAYAIVNFVLANVFTDSGT